MSVPIVDLTVYRKQDTIITFPAEGFDFTGSVMRLHVKAYPDAPGEPLTALIQTESGEGIRWTTTVADGLPTSDMEIMFVEATVNAVLPFPNGTEPGQPLKLAYDLLIVSPIYGRFHLMRGAFFIEPMVTVG